MNWAKVLILLMKFSIPSIIALSVYVLTQFGCKSTGSSTVFEQKQTNAAVENLCGGSTLIEVYKVDKNLGREAFCFCADAGKKSDANNCRPIVEKNNELIK